MKIRTRRTKIVSRRPEEHREYGKTIADTPSQVVNWIKHRPVF